MYNEEAVVPFLRTEVEALMREVPAEMEVVLVNDGSSDRTIDKIIDWAAADRRIKVIHLSRNFGHQLALTAGLDYATGEAVAIIDADLQDPLRVIHQMIEGYTKGYDVVYGQREAREGESVGFKVSAWIFYRLMRLLIYKSLPLDTGDFRLISRQCLDGLKSMRETHRFLRGMVTWVGYPQTAVKYQRASRIAGETKYPLRKLLALAWTAATSFSTVPLQLSIILGVMTGLLGLEEVIRAIVFFLIGRHIVPGWTSLMIVTCVVGGALLVCVGILGQYVGKIYEQGKERPLYLVSRTFNVTTHNTTSA
jgi:dolichol-phosphate mannosyltransferase